MWKWLLGITLATCVFWPSQKAKAYCEENTSTGEYECWGDLSGDITWEGDIVVKPTATQPVAHLEPGSITSIVSTGGSIAVDAPIDGSGTDGDSGEFGNPDSLDGQDGTQGATLYLATVEATDEATGLRKRGSVHVNEPIDLHGGDGGNGAHYNAFWPDETAPAPGGHGGSGAAAGTLQITSAQDIVFSSEASITTVGGSGGNGGMGGRVTVEGYGNEECGPHTDLGCCLGTCGGPGGAGGGGGPVTLTTHPYGNTVLGLVSTNGGSGGAGGDGTGSGGEEWALGGGTHVTGGSGGSGGPGGAPGNVTIDSGDCVAPGGASTRISAIGGLGGTGGWGAGASIGLDGEAQGGNGGTGGRAGLSAEILVTVRYQGALSFDVIGFGGNGGDGGSGGMGSRSPAGTATGGHGGVPGVAGSGDVVYAYFACRERYGDFDHDCDVDLTDFGVLRTCFNGPNQPPPAACIGTDGSVATDADGDGDVDMTDYSVFSAQFNGPNQPGTLTIASATALVNYGGDGGDGADGGWAEGRIAEGGLGSSGTPGGYGGNAVFAVLQSCGIITACPDGPESDRLGGGGGNGGNGGLVIWRDAGTPGGHGNGASVGVTGAISGLGCYADFLYQYRALPVAGTDGADGTSTHVP